MIIRIAQKLTFSLPLSESWFCSYLLKYVFCLKLGGINVAPSLHGFLQKKYIQLLSSPAMQWQSLIKTFSSAQTV